MQVKQLKKEGLKSEIEITVEAKELNQKIDQRLMSIGSQARVKGFRPGKVPLNILRKNYGRMIMGEILEQTVNESTDKALRQEGIKPANQPKIEIQKFDDGQDLVYKVEVEVFPEFKVMDFKSIEIEKPVADVDEDEIQEAIKRVAFHSRETKPLEKPRATKEGDIVEIDFDGETSDDNVKHPGMQGKGAKLELGSGQFIPGFEEQLVGKKSGDNVEVNVTFPENYSATELAGRPAKFDVTINAVMESVEPEINDDYAKNAGFDSLDALKKDIEKKIGAEYENISKNKMRRALLDILDEKHEFELPESNIDLEYKQITQQIEAERHQAHAHDHDHGPDHTHLSEEEQADYKDIAKRRVKLGLILAKIGEDNNLTVGDADVQRAIMVETQNYPGQEALVQEYYKNNPNAAEALRANIFENKVVEFILELVKVKETKVSAEELTRQDDDEDEAPKKKSTAKKSTAKKTTAKKTEADEKKEPAKKAPAKKKA